MVESGRKSDKVASGRIDYPATAPASNGLVVADAAGEAGPGGDGGIEAERGIGLPIGVVAPALGYAVIAQAARMVRADRDRAEGALRRSLPAVSAPAHGGAVASQTARCRAPTDRNGGETPLRRFCGLGASHDVAPALKGAAIAYSARLARSHRKSCEAARWGVNPGLEIIAPAQGGAVVSQPAGVAHSRGYGGVASSEV